MKTAKRLHLFLIARLMVIAIFLASTVALKLTDSHAIGAVQFKGIVELLLTSACFSLISLAASRKPTWLQSVTRLQTVWDILFVTVLLMLTGGISSPYSFLYLLAIMSAGMLLDRRQALYTAALCTILYGAMVDMQYYDLLQNLGLDSEAARQRGDLVLFYTIFLHLTGFVLAAIMASHLAERVRVSEVNLAELQQLHSTVVKNLDNGLMTITPDGMIRVFNTYLERLTGQSQQLAYNRSVNSLFEQLPSPAELLTSKSKGEFYYPVDGAEPLFIGYVAVPFKGVKDELSGLIISIKDLTMIKQMEQALKRSDRLAALGELSARMAHEIRNPLAAISGSIQILADHDSPKGKESLLFEIIMRESDRLNDLITDFLSYARPTPPKKALFSLYQLVQELETLLAGDELFAKIRLVCSVPSDLMLMADQSQIQQVLLNLLRNAADAMQVKGGEISLTAELQSIQNGSLWSRYKMLSLSVADQGCGFDDMSMQHLFEPFWTTKQTGSGLGLATVYRIIEAHGGTIKVDSDAGQGAVVTILLPVVQEAMIEQ